MAVILTTTIQTHFPLAVNDFDTRFNSSVLPMSRVRFTSQVTVQLSTVARYQT